MNLTMKERSRRSKLIHIRIFYQFQDYMYFVVDRRLKPAVVTMVHFNLFILETMKIVPNDE